MAAFGRFNVPARWSELDILKWVAMRHGEFYTAVLNEEKTLSGLGLKAVLVGERLAKNQCSMKESEGKTVAKVVTLGSGWVTKYTDGCYSHVTIEEYEDSGLEYVTSDLSLSITEVLNCPALQELNLFTKEELDVAREVKAVYNMVMLRQKIETLKMELAEHENSLQHLRPVQDHLPGRQEEAVPG